MEVEVRNLGYSTKLWKLSAILACFVRSNQLSLFSSPTSTTNVFVMAFVSSMETVSPLTKIEGSVLRFSGGREDSR